jgi:hypothetical protein
MSSEQLRRIAIALGVILVVWVGLRVVRGIARDEGESLPAPSVDRAAVDAIVLARPEDTIRFAKQGSGWTVNGFPAAPTAVTDLMNAVADTAAASELVAESPSTHERLGVDSAHARQVTLLSGEKPLYTLVIGKRGPNWESAYVRKPQGSNVYQIKGRLVELAERRVDDWRDKNIVQVPADSLGAIEVARGARSFTLTRADSVRWTLAGGGATDSSRVQSLLSQFSRLEASGFASSAQADSADFAKPDRLIKLLARGGRPLATLFLDSTSGGFWVRRDSLPTIYRIDSWVADQLTPTDSSLRKAAAGSG